MTAIHLICAANLSDQPGPPLGNIIEARYGKISGDIQIGIKLIGLTYYFNPDGTPNLEFDPKKNLFKFSRDEFMNEVQRP